MEGKPRQHLLRSPMISSMSLVLYLGGGLVLVTVFTKAVENLINLFLDERSILGSLAAILFTASVGVIAFLMQRGRIDRLLRAEANELEWMDVPGRPHLVMGFSPLRADLLAAVVERCKTIGGENIVSVCEDPKEFGRLGSWQQSLRLVQFLRNEAPLERLQSVRVIDNGSGQVGAFLSFLRASFAELTVDAVSEGPLVVNRNISIKPDYENFEYVARAIEMAIDQIAAATGRNRIEAEERTYVDFTPGFKGFSVAAAIHTLNRPMLALYVSSNSDAARVDTRDGGYTILGYDISARFNPRKG